MIDTPEVVESEAVDTAVTRFEIPRSEMQAAFEGGMEELMQVLSEQGMEPTGSFFARHFSFSPDAFDFELGVPVPAPVEKQGRVKPGELPVSKAGD